MVFISIRDCDQSGAKISHILNTLWIKESSIEEQLPAALTAEILPSESDRPMADGTYVRKAFWIQPLSYCGGTMENIGARFGGLPWSVVYLISTTVFSSDDMLLTEVTRLTTNICSFRKHERYTAPNRKHWWCTRRCTVACWRRSFPTFGFPPRNFRRRASVEMRTVSTAMHSERQPPRKR